MKRSIGFLAARKGRERREMKRRRGQTSEACRVGDEETTCLEE